MGLSEKQVQEAFNEAFTAEKIVNPETFQPVVHVKAEFTLELMHDAATLEDIKSILGEAVYKAIYRE